MKAILTVIKESVGNDVVLPTNKRLVLEEDNVHENTISD